MEKYSKSNFQKSFIWIWGLNFLIIYQLQIKDKIKDWNPQHAHNMTLQLSFNYGWMVSLFLSFTIFTIFVVTYRKIFMHKINNDNFYVDKIWFSASLICLLSNIGDINYFDGKISIIICILISGLKCILEEKSIFSKKSNQYFTS